MAWPFGNQSDDVMSDDENSRERLIEMGGVSIEEVPLPDAGDLSEEEAWTISPGPARARLGSTDVAAIVSKALPSVSAQQQPVQASVDTSGLERLVSSRLDTVEDTMRAVETRLLETLPAVLAASGMLNAEQAAAIASVLKKARVHFVSSLPAEALGQVGLVPFDDLDRAMAAAYEMTGPDARILVLPYGDSVLPQVAA